MKMIFNYHANKTYFHNKGFALSLVLKVRFFGTRKWPIEVKRTGWSSIGFDYRMFDRLHRATPLIRVVRKPG